MSLSSTRVAGSAEEVVVDALAGAEDPLLVNPSAETTAAVAGRLDEADAPGTARLLATADALAGLTEDFRTAAAVADLVAEGRLALRRTETRPSNTVLVADSSVVALVSIPGDDRVAGVTATERDVVSVTREGYEGRWRRAEEYAPDAPPLSRVRETLRTEVGAETARTFDRLLDAAAGDGANAVDEVTVSLLAAARSGDLLYDISGWGETVGLASKATFSRTKSSLEEAGLLETEKVPIEVGRPRLRLRLPASAADLAPAELVGRADARLSD